MKIVKPQVMGLLTRPFEFRREFWLGLATIAFLPVGNVPTLLPETAMWPFLAEELPPDLPLDAVIPKPTAEIVAIAHAHAPNGIAVPQLTVGIQLGNLIKKLNVWGDRRRAGSRISDPTNFTTMPIDWSRAYGGPEFPDNPIGKGAMAIEGSDGRSFEMPNLVDPRFANEDAPAPASFAPVEQMWPARAQMRGTYDEAWLKHDFPGLAGDIDWHHFNIAPKDQWLPEPLTGDETYAFMNLHPTEPLLRGRLPGMAPRIFLVRKGDEEAERFEEAALTLSTIWCFPHRERLVVIHHGKVRIAEEDASDIARIVVGADRLGALRPAAAFRTVMQKRLDRKNAGLQALRDEDLVPPEWLAPDAAQQNPPDSAHRQILARARKSADRKRTAERDAVKARFLDPDKFGPPPLPQEPPEIDINDVAGMIAQAEAEAAAQKTKVEAASAAKRAEMAKHLAAGGMAEAEIKRRLNTKAKGPPAFSAAGFLAEMTQQATAMRLLGQLTLTIEAQLAAPEFRALLDKAEAGLRNTYRLAAHHQDPADAACADRTAQLRQLIAQDPPAARKLYDLHGADLSGLDLSGLDLAGICLDGANLTGTSFAGANLANAVLAHATMAGCIFDDAEMSGANLGRANLAGASLRRARLRKSVLAATDLTGASLAGADIEGADLSEAIVTRADFTLVAAAKILALKLSMRGLCAPQILLTKAKFIECDLEDADFTAASLDQAVFIQTRLARVCFSGAQMRKTVFVQGSALTNANLGGADLTDANLRETPMTGANLEAANVARADFSGADLTDASLTRLNGDNSRWVAALLRRTDFTGASLAHADLSRADLRGANLTDVSVYEANMPRVKLDQDTQRAGMFLTRMRYQPTYQPPDPSAT